MQTVFTEKGVIPQTKLMKLQLLREHYYTQLVREVENLKIRIRQKVESYNHTVKELDTEIVREQKKLNPKFKELQSMNKPSWR